MGQTGSCCRTRHAAFLHTDLHDLPNVKNGTIFAIRWPDMASDILTNGKDEFYNWLGPPPTLPPPAAKHFVQEAFLLGFAMRKVLSIS